MSDGSAANQAQLDEAIVEQAYGEGWDLEGYARRLAERHVESGLDAYQIGRRPILTGYLSAYEKLVREAVRYFRGAGEQELALSYSAEWVLDNYYIVLQTLRQINESLPDKYYRELPKLKSGPLQGYPRIYALAREIIFFDRAHLNLERVESFVQSYSDASPFTMGELWALPIMLRLSVVQSLAVAISRITGIKFPITDQVSAIIDLAEMISDDEVVANSIVSLRTISAEDWKEFFEGLSLVEMILSRDPAGLYKGMDFDTRDRYRKVVEEIAVGASFSEGDIAREAIRLAQAAADKGLADGLALGRFRTSHVGYYLVERGREQLEESIGYRLSARERLSRWVFAHPTFVYLGGIGATTLALLLILAGYSVLAGGSPWQVAAVFLLALIPATTIAVDVINWLITNAVEPRVLPKLDFSENIPEEYSTMVVIPAMLSRPEELKPLLQQLELHFLRNPDPNLFFSITTDFGDAAEQHAPGDEELLEQARQGIQALNERYKREGRGPFYFFHRERRWNPKEGVWMGWERKRGKLHELNRLIMGGKDTSYTVQIGDLGVLPRIRFVITLDADTILPGKSAHRLVGTLAHPLNRAEFDGETGKVVAGYTVLQPRTEVNPSSANISLFTRVFSGDTGLDLYTLAVSDVYQDFFGEGIFVGKGIYDVRSFERSLEGCVPDNTLLSHDLFEGIHGRAGLVTDIVVIEDFPPNYLVHFRRVHRWIRGDWQLLPWLFPKALVENDKKAPNRLSVIDRWKIVDNLRRSLVMPVLLLLLVSAWTWLPGSPVFWTPVALLTLSVPFVTEIITLFAQALGEESKGPKSWRAVLLPLRRSAWRWFLAVALIPYEALFAADAVLTTLYRLIVTRSNLLKWTTAANTISILGERLEMRSVLRQMVAALALTTGLIALIGLVNVRILPVASPLLLVWLLSPEIVYWIGKPLVDKPAPLSDEERMKLRRLARRTWLFFEQYLGPEDHWLPPDHYQESPRGVVAHRTSPTNIGLAFLSTFAAYDLGYLGLLDLASRLRTMFENLEKLDKYRGHFLNWYDTRDLDPLPPLYVSTVDSGNLAISLVGVGQGCLSLLNAPVLRWETWQGLIDSLELLLEPIEEFDDSGAAAQKDAFREYLDDIKRRILAYKDTPERWPSMVVVALSPDRRDELDRHLLNLVESGKEILDPKNLRQLRLFTRSIHNQLDLSTREVKLLLPWLFYIARRPALLERSDLAPDVQGTLDAAMEVFLTSPTLEQIGNIGKEAHVHLARLQELLEGMDADNQEVLEARKWCRALIESLEPAGMAAKVLHIGFQALHRQCLSLVKGMDFGFLFDRQRQVFHIGFNVALGKLDNNYYDLLASEARTASLIAISKADIPQSHWLHLSRPLAQVDSTQTLLSWSATMFEYLMPLLHFRSYEGTLLHQSALAATDRHIVYGREKGTPWGISESGYYRFDDNMNYQYRAFGVPGLGYKRGLHEDLVITPYASLLALSLRPQAVVKNLQELVELGMMGTFGLYEAIDFTSTRLALGEKYKVVQSYMAHHQGMILVSLLNFLHENLLVERTHADPYIQSVELLLQEQIPSGAPLEEVHGEETQAVRPARPKVVTNPWRVDERAPQPRLHYLSNGRYTVMITSSGAGYSAWEDIDLTRWRADTTLNNWGSWIYFQDLDSKAVWSVGYQPTVANPQSRDVFFNAHTARFRRRDHDITVEMEVVVSPEDDIEVRRLTLTNHTDAHRRIRMASYAEVILAQQDSDERHPAFNKLFIQSEYISKSNALIFRRRPRSSDEKPVYMAHALVGEQGQTMTKAFETDRARFLGRGRGPGNPAALDSRDGRVYTSWLTGAAGATLDPVMSIGQFVLLDPHATVEFAYLTAAADSDQGALALVDRYHAWHLIERAFDQAHSNAEVELRQLGISTLQLEYIQNLLSLLVYPHRVLRAAPEDLAANVIGQAGLWVYAISGDYPVLLVRVHASEELALVHELLQAHAYWRRRRIKIDIVIINEQGEDYGDELNKLLSRLINRMKSDAWLNRRGGIFLVQADRLGRAERTLLESVARVILHGDRGSLKEQLGKIHDLPVRLPLFSPVRENGREPVPAQPLDRPQNLLFFNNLGGFTPDGKEYQIYLEPGCWTPAPWINVIANPDFGFTVTEAGSGYSWAMNSGENRLTPWSNDPVSDPPGEAIYLRDEETGTIWSPTPLPSRADAPYLIRHGAGYSIFEHNSHGLKQCVSMFAVPDAPVKVMKIGLQDVTGRSRRITVTYYAEWVLGVNREASQQYVVTEFDDESQALLACNLYNTEFADRVAFAAASEPLHGLTADREEFLGRAGSRAEPLALKRIGLSGEVSPGMDPCAALQIHIDLAPNDAKEFYFFIGQGANRDQTIELVRRYKDPQQVEEAWYKLGELWDRILGTVAVDTPDVAMNLLLNRWLLYQALACRIWGRSAFYQSSGAYGFRDQLQDVMSLVHAAPELAREHIVRAAGRQFEAGDVLHWWHPPSGRGVRTRYSDDLLWLPYAASYYITATGDESVLDEGAPFLRGPQLEPGEKERYDHYAPASENHTVLEHCRRAIERGYTRGPHGLPLIGGGDWNDGMNRVGIEGRGESVWLGWFLYDTLQRFADILERRGDVTQAAEYRQRAGTLGQALEESAWDGEWYLRAFYDDGSPLGSGRNREGQIDAIAQSWSILSKAGDPARAARAMNAVSERLVVPEDRIMLLITPPFDKTHRDPGYIKGYLPGIRENGGQYTHAAIWTVWAFAELGRGDYAEELFRMINPIYHGDTPEKVERYRVEPYVIAADVYSVPPLDGHGGWTWYTGSSGWMYRLGLEAILGLRREGQFLKIDPCIPKSWERYRLEYRYRSTRYTIVVENPDGANRGVRQVILDGKSLAGGKIPFLEDGEQHEVRVLLGEAGG